MIMAHTKILQMRFMTKNLTGIIRFPILCRISTLTGGWELSKQTNYTILWVGTNSGDI